MLDASTQYSDSCSSLELNMIALHFWKVSYVLFDCVFVPLHMALLEIG